LIGQPTKCGKRHYPLRTDHDQAAKAMSDTRQARVTAIYADAVLKNQMAAINARLNAVSV
jgi:hypothetical protein